MTEQPAEDPFHDCELSPEAILGTHTFEDVLFTDETETPVNVLTGQTPAHSQATVDEASEFAASIDTDTPQIALPSLSRNAQIETASKPHGGRVLPFQGNRLAQTASRLPRGAYEADGFSSRLPKPTTNPGSDHHSRPSDP